MSDTVIEEYIHSGRIIEQNSGAGKTTTYLYESPSGERKAFEEVEKARLYADVQTITGGFREEKTGKRGAPPTVAQAREDVLMGYYAAQPGMSKQWVAEQFNLPEDRVQEYIRSLRTRAEQKRADIEDRTQNDG